MISNKKDIIKSSETDQNIWGLDREKMSKREKEKEKEGKKRLKSYKFFHAKKYGDEIYKKISYST